MKTEMKISLILFSLALTSCNNITPEQVETVHDLYHVLTDTPCIFVGK